MLDELQQIDELLAEPQEAQPGEAEQLAAIDELLDPSTPEKEAVEDATADEVETPEPGIDYTLEVPMTDGTKLSLGALKDHYQDYAAKVEALVTRENETMAKINESQELLALVGNVPQHLQAKIKQDQQQYLERQHEMMLQVMPEMADPATFNKVKADVFELAKEYGVADIIAQVTDHRLVKMLSDYSKLKQSIRAAKDNVKPIRNDEPKSKTAAKSNQNVNVSNAIAHAQKSGTNAAQIAAISMLLK